VRRADDMPRKPSQPSAAPPRSPTALKSLDPEDYKEKCLPCKGEGQVPRHAPFRFRACDFCGGRGWRWMKGTPEKIIKRYERRLAR
jgi:hypothetical protein